MIFSHSIRWRIQLWHTLLLAIIVSVLLFAFHRSQREITYEILDRELRGTIIGLLPSLKGGGPGGRPGGPRRRQDDFEEFGRNSPDFDPGRRGGPGGRRDDRPDQVELAEIDERVEELIERDLYVIAWDRREDDPIYRSTNAPVDAPARPEETEIGFTTRTREGYREVMHQSPIGEILISGTSLAPYEQKLSQLQYRLIGIGAALVALGFLVGWLLISRSLKPIRAIGKTAHGIAKGDLSKRIMIRDSDGELGKLSSVLNETFGKLESSFEHQIRFTADASHEMRTPVSVILAKAQLALRRERTPEKYQEALRTCMDSAQHMRSLIDSLLELSRVDSGEFNLHREDGDVARMTGEVVELIRPLAEEKKITLTSALSGVTVSFDPQRLRQALLNLLGNAVKYCREGDKINVTLTAADRTILLTITDTGPGISEENLPHLFERFYRADKARSRGREDGTGLGLAITQAIVKAHGGSITVQSTVDVGTTFGIELPRVPGI